MSVRRPLLILASVIVYAAWGFVSAGCMEGLPVGDACTSDPQCGPGFVCESNVCAEAACASDAEVAHGHVCDEVAGQEREPAGVYSCPNGQVAEDASGDCVPEATSDVDCGPGEQEAGGQCVASPCQDSPFDTCPNGFVCDAFGDCVPGTKSCGDLANPAREACTDTGVIVVRCEPGGFCPPGQDCHPSGYCEPRPCTPPDGTECFVDASICDAGLCVAQCVFSGCGLFDSCNEITGVCEGDSGYTLFLPASSTAYTATADPVVDIQLPVSAGVRQIHTVDVAVSGGMTLDDFTLASPTVSLDGVALPVAVIDLDTLFVDLDLDAQYDPGDEPVAKRDGATRVVLTLPDGGDRTSTLGTSATTGTFAISLKVSVPSDGTYAYDVTVTGIDGTTGGLRDSFGFDPTSQTQTYYVNASSDLDGDGLPDDYELNITGTDPANADTDRDGARDDVELSLGLPANDHDADRNGVADGREILYGSDPLDPTSLPQPQLRSAYPTPNLHRTTFTATAPVAFESGPGSIGVLWADPASDEIFTTEVVGGLSVPSSGVYGPGDIPVACGGFDGVGSLDGLGTRIILTATCSADGQVRVLGGSLDGSTPLVVLAENGMSVGGEPVSAIQDATLAGTPGAPVLAVVGDRASGPFLALDDTFTGPLDLRLAASDLGATSFAQLEADGDAFLSLGSPPDRVVRVDLVGSGATGTSVVVDASTDTSFFDSTQALSSLGIIAVGGGGLGVEFTAGDGRSGIVLLDQGGGFVEIVAEVGRAVPGGTYGGGAEGQGIWALSGLSVFGDRAVFEAQDQYAVNALYGHLIREDGTPSSVQKIFHRDDTHDATTANLFGAATGGRASMSLTGSRAMAGELVATRARYTNDFEIAVLEPGPPIPRAVLLATRPAGDVTNLYRFPTSPPIFFLQEALSTGSLSSAARSPLTGEVRLGAGFSGAVDPNVGGGISSYGTGSGPLAFVGQTASLTATPGLEFDPLGGLWASASVDDGYSSVLASIDPSTGADSVVGSWFIAPSTPVTGIDALAFAGGDAQAMWAFTSSTFDGTPGDVWAADLSTAELVQVGDLTAAYANIVGASYSLAGDLFVSTGGSGGGTVAWVDASALTAPSPPPGVAQLPYRILADIQILSQSISDLVVVDADGDDLDDFAEAAYGTSPTDADSDGDGLGDGAEALRLSTSPVLADSDGDGLGDGEERVQWGSDPLLVDSDGGGASDGFEVAMGTDPLDPLDDPVAPVPVLGAPALGMLAIMVVSSTLVLSASRRRRPA